jgi:hypothetical protein
MKLCFLTVDNLLLFTLQHKEKHKLQLITNYSQQDANFLEFISTDALHVSGASSAHHQEHINVHTASGIVN